MADNKTVKLIDGREVYLDDDAVYLLDATHGTCIEGDLQLLFDTIVARDARIAELEAQQRWVPVEEPPKTTREYLTWRPGLGQLVSWFDADGGWLTGYPTHWRPLPAPPQEGES